MRHETFVSFVYYSLRNFVQHQLTVFSFETPQIDKTANYFELSKWHSWLSNQTVLWTKSPTKASYEIFTSFIIIFKRHSTLFDLCSCSRIDKFRENHWEILDPRLSLGTSSTEVLAPCWLQREKKDQFLPNGGQLQSCRRPQTPQLRLIITYVLI
jgi:hypothetical protein